MPRFICWVGEDPEVFVSDDENVVQQYSEQEWFVVYDSQDNVWFSSNSDGEPKTPKTLPDLGEEEGDDDE